MYISAKKIVPTNVVLWHAENFNTGNNEALEATLESRLPASPLGFIFPYKGRALLEDEVPYLTEGNSSSPKSFVMY